MRGLKTLDHLISTEKTVRISVKTFFFFFFWRSHHNSDKTAAFFPSVLVFQNRKSAIFELAPGPRSALGAPALKW